MDNRCASCKVELGRRKLSQTIMSRLELDCPHCRTMIRLNIHPLEAALVMINGAVVLVLALFAYWQESQTLTIAALIGAGLTASMLPLVELTWLRNWPRYALIAPRGDA